MKKSIIKSLFGLFILLTIAVAPRPADAMGINIENPYPHTLHATIVYFEDSSGKWVTRGWYNVKPNSTRKFDFSGSTKKDHVYIYAYTSEASWGDNGNRTITRTVIKEAFKYYDGQSCPEGSNRRNVSLAQCYMENDGIVYWRP